MPEPGREIMDRVGALIDETGCERTQLLEVLHRVQAEFQHIPRAAAEAIEQRMNVPVADTYGLVTFYDLLTEHPVGRSVLRICEDVPCCLHGSDQMAEEAAKRLGPEGEPSADGGVSWTRCACLGLCDKAPAALWREQPLAPLKVHDIEGIGDSHA
jgi:NADH:ubiquinone oxidoreductase subunit E